jgi:hypothetical protein
MFERLPTSARINLERLLISPADARVNTGDRPDLVENGTAALGFDVVERSISDMADSRDGAP